MLNHEGLKVVTCENQLVHHVSIEDETVLEFLGDFDFSNPIECTEAEIDKLLECTNPCDVGLDTKVVDVVILSESTEKDCALADDSDMVL